MDAPCPALMRFEHCALIVKQHFVKLCVNIARIVSNAEFSSHTLNRLI